MYMLKSGNVTSRAWDKRSVEYCNNCKAYQHFFYDGECAQCGKIIENLTDEQLKLYSLKYNSRRWRNEDRRST